jgi:hypothetical protein
MLIGVLSGGDAPHGRLITPFSDDVDAQIVGFDILAKLQSSRLATRADRELFAELGTPVALGDDTDAQVADTGPEEAR